jgi:prepilin-type N-terminal cleavage/methylation domain-containing protein
MFFKITYKINKGFTLVETLVGVAVFLVIAVATYQAYVSLFTLINLNQYKIVALNLANEQFEIIRNLPYADVGIPSGIPNGKIPHVQNLNRSNINFIVTTIIRNIDLPFDGTIGSSTKPDLSPADNKSVEVEVACPTCKNFVPLTLTTTVAPKNLETASTNGAILIKVFDSNGVPVSDAAVHIVNSKVTPNIIIDDVTDIDGLLQIVDAPPGTNAYKISVTKVGYSTDRTYTPGQSGNTNPTKPDVTVIVRQLTQISFSIDRLSTITASSVAQDCTVVPNFDFNLKGAKTIGAGVLKFNSNLVTGGNGTYSTTTMEWDNYTLTGVDSSYDLIGLNPLNPISVGASSTQGIQMVVADKDPRSLLITVKDNTTKLPVTDAIVKLTKLPYSVTKFTGRGSLNQTDWSIGGSYTADDGHVDVTGVPGEVKLLKVFGSYVGSGWLESSTIDTGSLSNFYSLTWSPADQPVPTGTSSVKFRFATNATTTATTTWDYRGPDGTDTSYYTVPYSVISPIHNGDRYARYRLYLSSQSTSTTPNISDVAFTVTTSCTPPGQVVFSGLSSGTYNISVNKSGYPTYETNVSVSSNWVEKEIILTP